MTPNQEYDFAYRLFKENDSSAAYPLAIGIITAKLEIESKESALDNIRAVLSALHDANSERLNG